MSDFEMAEKMADFLNGLLELDRPAIAALIANRVPCNEKLAEHHSVQVTKQHGGCHVTMLGILNGLCGSNDTNGWGGLVAVFDEHEEKDKVGGLYELKKFRAMANPWGNSDEV